MPTQFAEPAVSRAKFEREVAQYRELEDEYRRRGWFLIYADFPRAVAVLAAPQLRPPAVVTAVLFDYTNYDAQAPSVLLANPFTLEPYKGKDLPTTLLRSVPAQLAVAGLPEGARLQAIQQQPLMQFHSPDDVPFLCIAGVREYHEHPGHSGDAWELHRHDGAGRLVRLLDVIHQYGVLPISDYAVTLVPQIGFAIPQVPS